MRKTACLFFTVTSLILSFFLDAASASCELAIRRIMADPVLLELLAADEAWRSNAGYPAETSFRALLDQRPELYDFANVARELSVVLQPSDFRPDQIAAIERYKAQGLHEPTVNEALRSSPWTPVGALRRLQQGSEISELRAALQSIPHYEGIVFRSPSGMAMRGQTLIDYTTVGTIVTSSIFMSTTRSATSDYSPLAGANRNYLIIRSRTGRSIENAGEYFRHEHEVLFLPGTQFRVEAVIETHNGRTNLIFLDEVLPEG